MPREARVRTRVSGGGEPAAPTARSSWGSRGRVGPATPWELGAGRLAAAGNPTAACGGSSRGSVKEVDSSSGRLSGTQLEATLDQSESGPSPDSESPGF